MSLPDAHPPAPAAASPNARTRKCRMRMRGFGRKELEQHFPICFTTSSPTCAICLSTITSNEPCRVTTCNHEFHADCIMKWWTKEVGRVVDCPVCRVLQKVSASRATEVKLAMLQEQVAHRQHKSCSPFAKLLESLSLSPIKPVRMTSHAGRATAAQSRSAASAEP